MSGAIGVSRPRLEAPEKVTGATRYAGDDVVPGLLHARLVLSTEAHALIRGIDAGEALTLPGVVAVLTAGDLPVAEEGSDRGHEPLAREEVVFAGQPVAVVVAETEADAEAAAELVVVGYEPLEAVVDVEAAMEPGAPLARVRALGVEGSDLGSAHADAGESEESALEEDLSPNVVGRVFHERGDVVTAFAESDVVVSGRFHTPWLYQAYLEPQTATAWMEPGDVLAVSTSTQGVFASRREVAGIYGLPFHRVRVRAAALGGAFGGKFALIEPLVAGIVLALRRPVRLALTRSEDFQAANPGPAQVVELRIGARRNGELTALSARILCDRGIVADWGNEGITASLIAGPYRWRAAEARGYGVLTNRVSFGAYRAPGAPPAAFALESLLDELARELDVDPIELRLRNAVSEGDETLTGRVFPAMGVRECLERVREHPIWQERDSLPENEGVGVAIGYWGGGLEPTSAACRLDGDGRLTVITGAVDMSGTETTFAAIAAEAFGLPIERVRVVAADSSAAPHSASSGGSKITYTVGRAVQRAAEEARERLLHVASEELEIAPTDLEVVDGAVRAVGAPERSLPIEELAGTALAFGGRYEPIAGNGSVAQRSQAPGTACHLTHVRLDPETGGVEILRHAIAQDVGRALNPALVEGQMRGGAAQGIGAALYEELVHDEDGRLLSGSFLDYAVPTAERVPPIDTLIVEVPAPDGPFGARGVGEPPVIAAPAAIANAIADAAGVRPRRLPMTAPRIWALLRERDEPAQPERRNLRP
jgi:CO/xanthine dehydrogenase Mo-binding subunit